ncbi:hypothetical protein Ddep01_00072 [Deinococcus depolymerans]
MNRLTSCREAIHACQATLSEFDRRSLTRTPIEWLTKPFNPSGLVELRSRASGSQNGFRMWNWQSGVVPDCRRNKRQSVSYGLRLISQQRPPVEECVPGDQIRLSFQPDTAFRQGSLHLLDALEHSIRNRCIRQLPQPFRRLQFRRVRRQRHRLNPLRMPVIRWKMETSPILNDQHPMVGASADLLRKRRHDGPVRLFVHHWDQPEQALAALRIDKRVHIQPLVSRLNWAGQRLPSRRPHGTPDRFEPDSMFVHAPQRDTR